MTEPPNRDNDHMGDADAGHEPEFAVELIKDLDVQETERDGVRGGNSAVAGGSRVPGASK